MVNNYQRLNVTFDKKIASILIALSKKANKKNKP